MAAGAGVGGGQKDALGVICSESMAITLPGDRVNTFFLKFESVFQRLTSARGARNNEIERHRVRSCQAPQMPNTWRRAVISSF